MIATSAVWLGLTTAALAADSVTVNAKDMVMPGSVVSYGDLANHFLPDLKGDGSKADLTTGPGVRHLGGEEMRAGTEQTEPEQIKRLAFDAKDGKRALLMFDFGPANDSAQSVSILGLYDLSGPSPVLLDAADVGYDRFTSFQAPELAFAAPEAPVAFTVSSHFNAGEAFVQTSLVSLAGERLTLIDSIGTMNWNGCAYGFMSELSFRSAPGTIRATINVTKTKIEGGGCEPDANERRIKSVRLEGRYVWEAGRKRFKALTPAFKNIPFPSGADE